MRTRLLPLLIVLMAGVLLALGIPLGVITAGVEQQRVVIDRIDDAARFASLAQFVTARPAGDADGKTPEEDERRATLRTELARYYGLYGIRAGVFYRDHTPMAAAPSGTPAPATARAPRPSGRRWPAVAATTRTRSGPGTTPAAFRSPHR